MLAFPEIPDLAERRQSPQRLISGFAMVLMFAIIGLYVAYGVRYTEMIEDMRELSLARLDWNQRVSKIVSDRPDRLVPDYNVSSLSRLGDPTGTVEDSNERIAAVVLVDLQRIYSIRSLAIWGWAPGVYVLTGLPPATRDAIGHFAISQGPMQGYFRARFLGDLRKQPPDLFVDAVAPDVYMWRGWTENDGYESDLRLRKFVDDNYVLVDELTLVEGEKPVRFFMRREAASQPQ